MFIISLDNVTWLSIICHFNLTYFIYLDFIYLDYFLFNDTCCQEISHIYLTFLNLMQLFNTVSYVMFTYIMLFYYSILGFYVQIL